MKQWNEANPEWRRKHNEHLSELWNTEEKKEYAKQRAKKQFEDPEQRKAAAERARLHRNRRLTWEITFPDGKKETTDDLPSFSYKYQLDAKGLRRVANVNQKQYKGFTCRKI